MDLILDVKIAIVSSINSMFFPHNTVEDKNYDYASGDVIENMLNTPWYKLTRIDEEFAEYSRSEVGIARFITLYKEIVNASNGRLTTFFGRLHSFHGEPALYVENSIMAWAKFGLLHNEDYFPSAISGYEDTSIYIYCENGRRYYVSMFENKVRKYYSQRDKLYWFDGAILRDSRSKKDIYWREVPLFDNLI